LAGLGPASPALGYREGIPTVKSKDLMQKIQEIAGVAVRIGGLIEIQGRKIGSDTGIRTRILALREQFSEGLNSRLAVARFEENDAIFNAICIVILQPSFALLP